MVLITITVLSGGHTVRHSLMNLLAVLTAAFLQFRWTPFAQVRATLDSTLIDCDQLSADISCGFAQLDANLAEGLTLVSTVLILVIGLGQQAVGDPSDLPQDQLDSLDQDPDGDDDVSRDREVLDDFLLFCYVIMGLCISAAMCVILRRLGGVWFMLNADFDSSSRLSDAAIDMIDKSKMDTAKAWAGIMATEQRDPGRLKRIDRLFAKVREFNGGDNQRGLEIKLDRTSGAFINFFPEQNRPAMYAWMSAADPADVMELERFTQSLYEIAQLQTFAIVPKCVRVVINRWVGSHAPQIPMHRRGSLMNRYLRPADQVFRLADVEEDEEDEDMVASQLRISISNPVIGEAERRELQLWDQSTQFVSESFRHGLDFVARGRVGSDRRCYGAKRCEVRVFTLVLVASIAAMLVVLALVVDYLSAGCCPGSLPEWNEAGFGLNSEVQTCDPTHQQRGSSCTVRCRTGYLSVLDSNYSFVCEQSTHPSWAAIDPSRPPRCIKDGCYTPDNAPSKCLHQGPDSLYLCFSLCLAVCVCACARVCVCVRICLSLSICL